MTATVYLSRRNLETLLAKLDHVRMGGESACTLLKRDHLHPEYPESMKECLVIAVENEPYYAHREPGPVAELPLFCEEWQKRAEVYAERWWQDRPDAVEQARREAVEIREQICKEDAGRKMRNRTG